LPTHLQGIFLDQDKNGVKDLDVYSFFLRRAPTSACLIWGGKRRKGLRDLLGAVSGGVTDDESWLEKVTKFPALEATTMVIGSPVCYASTAR